MKGVIDFVIAYMVIWLGLFGYMVYLNIKQKKLKNEIELLKKVADKNESGK